MNWTPTELGWTATSGGVRLDVVYSERFFDWVLLLTGADGGRRGAYRLCVRHDDDPRQAATDMCEGLDTVLTRDGWALVWSPW